MLEVLPLKKPRTILQWYSERDNLDLSPSYQRRGDLWPLRYRQLLINSVLNGFDVPKIYMADFTYVESNLNENRKPFALIDGKQRLTTFFAFLGDTLRLDDTPVYWQRERLNLNGFSYPELQYRYPGLARKFEEFTPTVMSVISDSLEDVQELFIRLNLSVSISGPEKRNAMPGPLPHLIRDLSVHEFFRKYATFPINRGQDLNAAAKFLLMEDLQGFASVKKKDLDRFVDEAKDRPKADFEEAHARAHQTLGIMSKVFRTEDPILSRQAQITIYYWLCRTHGSTIGPRIRDFLHHFELERAKARAASNARAQGLDVAAPEATLTEYNGRIRSPDDKATQELLFTILEARLQAFISQGPPTSVPLDLDLQPPEDEEPGDE
jgi:hypothetical protein